jgi:hypothetical protein
MRFVMIVIAEYHKIKHIDHIMERLLFCDMVS